MPPPKSRNGLGRLVTRISSSLLWLLAYQCLDRDSSGTIINVRVGSKENERIFQIHKAKLTASSPLINKKVRDGGVSQKGDDLAITLKEVDSIVLKLFQWWLYTDKLAETGRVKYARYRV